MDGRHAPPRLRLQGRVERTVRIVVCTVVALAGKALAHQPRFPDPETTSISNPEVSQAFYGELDGGPALFRIAEADSFQLYAQLLVPDIPGVTKDYIAEVFTQSDSGRELLGVLDGPNAEWGEFFERFAGDNYFMGPEFEKDVGPGNYFVEVSSPDSRGKYVLVIGRAEAFPPGEIVRTIALMPKLKRDYFGKPVYQAFTNYVGVFIGATALVVAGIVVGIVLLARRRS